MTDLLIILRMLTDLLTGGDPTLPSGHNELIPIAQLLSAIRDYVLAILDDGDYLNDWLTHIPASLQPLMLVIGHLIATFGGR